MARVLIVLNEKQIEELPKYGRAGLNIIQIASILGISKSALDDIIKRQPEVKEAIEKGRADAILQVGSTAFQLAVSGKVPAMTMFYLKCRAGWSEQPKDLSESTIIATKENIGELIKAAKAANEAPSVDATQ